MSPSPSPAAPTRATELSSPPTLLLFGFEHATEALSAAARLRNDVPEAERVLVEGLPGSDPLEGAAHATAWRLAARGVGTAVAISAVTTLAAAVLASDPVVPAVGLVITLMGAPFIGGLTGFLTGLHRWSPTTPPIDDGSATAPLVLVVRAPDPEAAIQAVRFTPRPT